MKVGFVGLGHTGSGMAASLLKAGHEVTVYNRTRAKAEPLIAQGAIASIADAARIVPSSPCWQTTTRSRAWCSAKWYY